MGSYRPRCVDDASGGQRFARHALFNSGYDLCKRCSGRYFSVVPVAGVGAAALETHLQGRHCEDGASEKSSKTSSMKNSLGSSTHRVGPRSTWLASPPTTFDLVS